jgi:hypothetical protein
VVEWLDKDCHDTCPPVLLQSMQQIVSKRGADEAASRACLRDHDEFLRNCRLPPQQVVHSLCNALRIAIQHVELPPEAPTSTGVLQPTSQEEAAETVPKYISIVLDDGKSFADAVFARLPPPEPERPDDGRKDFHVTLWHSQAHGALPPHLVALRGAQVVVQARTVAANEFCVCASVEVGEPCVGLCMNDVPHITLWTAQGTLNKYSNELLGHMPETARLPGAHTTVPDVGGAYFASLVDTHGQTLIQPFKGKVVFHF